MTDLTDMQNDAMEHAEHSKHAAESGDPMTLQVTLSIAVMAVIAAFIGALGETEASHTFVEKSDAVLSQARASDSWAAYQAESIKRHIYDVGASASSQPDVVARLKGEADKYAKEQPDAQAQAKHFEELVETYDRKAETHFDRHHILTIAEGLVHVAVAAASIALLSRRRAVWFGALALTAIGMVVAGVAYAI
jgi:hypothetical protein